MKTSLNTIIQIAFVSSLLFDSLATARELVVSTAASGNTYDVMIQQLANSCNPQMNTEIVNRSSTGSMENIDRLLHNEVAAAIVQTDVLRYRDTRDDLKRIKVLFPLHSGGGSHPRPIRNDQVRGDSSNRFVPGNLGIPV